MTHTEKKSDQELPTDPSVVLLEQFICSASEFGIVTLDDQLAITHINAAAQDVFAASTPAAVGRSIIDVHEGIGVDCGLVRDAIAETESVGHSHYDLAFIDSSQSSRRVHVAVMPQRTVDGEMRGYIIITNDITKQQLLWDGRCNAEKMSAVARLAAGVAHDFNNQLTVIIGYARLLTKSLEQDNPAMPQIEEIVKAADRAHDVTRKLLVFSRQQLLNPSRVDVNDTIDSMRNELLASLSGNVTLDILPWADLGTVETDVDQLEIALTNLVLNATEAMTDGGVVTIRTANVELDEDYACTEVNLKPGAYVLLSVSDTGVGMDSATMAAIFEPFYSTRSGSDGKGLGLAMVYGFVKQSGGHIEVTSQLGKGSEFKVLLPRIA